MLRNMAEEFKVQKRALWRRLSLHLSLT